MKSAKKKALESEVRRIFNRRTSITKAAIRTANRVLRDTAEANPTRRKHEYWCSNCGGKFNAATVVAPATCPHCGARLKYNHDKCRLVFKSEHYLREAVVYGDWQVIKEYIVDAEHRSGKAVKYDIAPIYLWWFNPKEHATLLFTRYLVMMPGWKRIPFSLYSNFYFRRTDGGNYWWEDWKDTEVDGGKMLDYYRIRGIDGINERKHCLENVLAAYTIHDSILETLVKTGQREAADLFIRDSRYRKKIVTYWRSWVLARRHGFNIGAVGEQTYLDYLDNLRMLHRDLRNPFFICPADFGAAHAETSRKAAKILTERAEKANATRRAKDAAFQARLQAERLERMKREQLGFARRIRRFAALIIADENLTIRPLMSIDEFKAEGDAMQHCVWTNAYYARPECLILSAKDKNGNRIETIEVNLRDWRVIQSRGFRNGTTRFHEEIVGLVLAAMPEIKKLTKTKKSA